MDLDRYIALHQGSWSRLEEYATRARRGARRLTSSELAEMVDLYQRTSAHLAHVRTRYDDVALIARLSYVLGLARGTIYRKRSHPGTAILTFFTRTFPAAVWECRRQIAVAAFLLLAPAVAMGFWLSGSDDARSALVDPETQTLIAERDFAEYYRSDAAAAFQTKVTVNNIQVSFLAFATGILAGIPTAIVLVTNGASIGTVGAVMHAAGQGSQFWGLITPHGLLELTSIVIAGGAGLRLGWTLIAPGDRTRASALAEEGLRAVVLVVGVILTFVVAGFIEAWVTPSNLPTWARVGIGVVVEIAFLVYAFGQGRIAASSGYRGGLDDQEGDPVASEPTGGLDVQVGVGQ
ncbi:MAG TPA: stage II sporulation protein M [Microthrixaceae bacterium]|nr:stage II sporulation protein M [Microthrixaceae bacterium]